MRILLLPAGCIALALLLPAAGVRAQSTLEAPSITSVTAAETSLTIAWSAPGSDGGSAVTAYDLRYIRSDARDKADDDWTLEEAIWSSGALEYELTGLTRDTSYDLQVRAVNADGDGPWSDPPFTEGTTDHGDTREAATALQLPSSITGRIDPATMRTGSRSASRRGPNSGSTPRGRWTRSVSCSKAPGPRSGATMIRFVPMDSLTSRSRQHWTLTRVRTT